MPSAKELRDLAERTPAVLREPERGPVDDSGPKGALIRWAAARGFNPPEAVRLAIRDPEDDETVGTALVGNVAVMALVYQLQVDAALERTIAIDSAKRGVPVPPRTRAVTDVEYLAHMRRVKSNDTYAARLNLSVLTKQAHDALEEHRTMEELRRAQIAEYLELFTAIKQQLTVPIVASGYMNHPQRSSAVSEKTSLLDYITGIGVPLPRALAMIGELRNGNVPVDIEHPKLDKIYDSNEINLRRLRSTLQKARDRSTPIDRDLSLAPRGKKRHKRQGKVNAQNARKKR